jgi:dTMP kinase
LRGKFITFEGIDGSGKSTQLRMLASHLRARGLDPITTCEPGGTPLGRHLRQAFLETEETVAPMAELLLFAADRAQHVEFLIRPSIAKGRIVISDRFADATAAYQGAGRGFEPTTVAQIIGLATDGLKPDLTLFFDISVETAMDRMNNRPDTETRRNRMDAETAEFYSRVREEYLAIARREPSRFVVLNAEGSIEEIHSQVVAAVAPALG